VTASKINDRQFYKTMPAFWRGCMLFCFTTSVIAAQDAAVDPVEGIVLSLFERKCVTCHGADTQESGLRLDGKQFIALGGEHGPVVRAGKSRESELYQRITSKNADERMPPESEEPLSADEIEQIKQWIEFPDLWKNLESAGVAIVDKRMDHWAWKPIVRPTIPMIALGPGVTSSVDRFIREKILSEGLLPSPQADRRTLIRRVTFDLLGLPPSPHEVDAFVADTDPMAWENLVERLLASPRYGERWARHWLDVVHYGDTHGYDKDQPRPNAWPYRDYVIRALNTDKPYVRFIEEQIAGDMLYPDTRDGIEALGFISAGPWDLIGHAEVPETKIDGKIARHLDRDDMVANTIGTFMSATVQCAQCHNHKFDPFTQEDYYSLQAVFSALDRTDKPYSSDPKVMKLHESLNEQKRTLESRKKELTVALQKIAGPRLIELEQEIAAAEAKTGNASQEFGYHSAIATDRSTVKWVQVDLGAEYPVDSVVLRPCYDDFNMIGAGFGFPARYKIEISNDSNFQKDVTTIVSHESADQPNPGVTQQEFFCGKNGRFVRMTTIALAPRQNDFIFALAELEVRNTEGKNLAARALVSSLDSIEAPLRWSQKNLVDGLAPQGSGNVVALLAERKALVEGIADQSIVTHLADCESDLAAVLAQQNALAPLDRVYAGTVHVGSGTFLGTGAVGGKPRPIHLLLRGQVTQPSREVSPGAMVSIQPLEGRFNLPPDHREGDRRVALVRWITDSRNPLTWRSIVNRIWHYHFGRGIVDSPNDFGHMGSRPSHPELLDWLACEFRDSGGSLKSLHRTILHSATYRQSSAFIETNAQQDTENRFLWRYNRRRLEAEAIHDSVLDISGSLDLTMGGPGWKDFKVERPEHSPHYRYDLADPMDRTTWRRSIYRFLVRSQTQPLMTSLDCADPSMRVDKRNESLSPIQALALLNNGFMVVQAKQYASRLAVEAGDSHRDQIRLAFRLALCRDPDPSEQEALESLAVDYGMENVCRLIFNLSEFTFID